MKHLVRKSPGIAKLRGDTSAGAGRQGLCGQWPEDTMRAGDMCCHVEVQSHAPRLVQTSRINHRVVVISYARLGLFLICFCCSENLYSKKRCRGGLRSYVCSGLEEALIQAAVLLPVNPDSCSPSLSALLPTEHMAAAQPAQ